MATRRDSVSESLQVHLLKEESIPHSMTTYESRYYGFDSRLVLCVCSRKANNEAQQRAYNPKGRDTLAVMCNQINKS